MRTRVIVVAVWFAFAAAASGRVAAVKPVAASPGPLSAVAASLPGWTFEDSSFSGEQDLLESRVRPMCDDSLTRTYRPKDGQISPLCVRTVEDRDTDGMSVEVQVFYCASRRPKNRLVYYLDTIQCLHGHYPRVDKSLVQVAEGIDAVRLRLAKRATASVAGGSGLGESTVVYWLQSPGRTSPEYFPHAAWLYWRDLAGRRTDGCFVKIAYYGAPSPGRDARLAALAAALHSELDSWLGAATYHAQ